ncbi:MAG: Nif3-like dinuclear metal center hexameric protein [Endomicrobium sp.]|jgi:putative NIF3 family GTP cyclohydrolase 1 type 2|nr:Nif3-like dinuclear metal center hexameric protein [Endomicrobium sp.]
MKLKDVHGFFIKEGIEVDPRGLDVIKLDLLKRKEEYDALSDMKKENYDVESLTNPYYDSRILCGDENIEIKTVMVGIDIESQEVLLAKQLIDSGNEIDLIIAHHPEGYAYSTFYNIIGMQADILNKQGVPINIAEKIVSDRIKEVQRSLLPQNNERIYDMAKLLNIPVMTAHTVADNHVVSFLQREIKTLNPTYLKEIVELLNKYPEYQHASKIGHAPFILNGNDYSRCGKVFVDMTGGTEGSVKSFEKLEIAGIGTIVSMHLSSKGALEAKKHHINVILAGHISSDNLGMNLLFDKLENKTPARLKFIECSGFRRFKR